MRAVIVGCGNWGARVAKRLQQLGVTITAVVDADQQRGDSVAHSLGQTSAARDLNGLLDNMRPDAVVIATPPADHVRVFDIVLANGIRKIRVEKPLAPTLADAQRMVRKAKEAGAELTTGFTLLHHPLYEAAFTYAAAAGGIEEVQGMRVGAKPAHNIDPFLDLGAHTAGLAAFAGAPCTRLVVAHMYGVDARTTTFATPYGDIVVDELALTIRTPDGDITGKADHDALGRDLSAWIQGDHRGTPTVALTAQAITEGSAIECAA